MSNPCGQINFANDECYTTREIADYVINKYFYLLEGKKVILPCDCEWSELYKVCKEKGIDCEIAQDMWGTDYSKYDLVFTNPPFHKLNKWIRFLNNNNVKYLLFAPWIIIARIVTSSHDFYNKVYYLEDFTRGDLVSFKRPDGTSYNVHWGLITNLEEGKAIVSAKPDIRIEATNEFQHYKGIWSDLKSCNYLKYDYLGVTKKGGLKVRLAQSKLKKAELWK